MNARPTGESGEKMKGDGEGESGGTRKSNFGKLNNDIKMTRREFIKASAAFGAAAAGVPYSLTDITNVFLKEDGELVIYPVICIDEHEFESAEIPFERIINIELFGCNWNCKHCFTKYLNKDTPPVKISVDKLGKFLLNLDNGKATLVVIDGEEPLLQRVKVLRLINLLKTRSDYIVMLGTNGSLINGDFIERANDVGLDRIMINFFHLDDNWHKKFTDGYSNQNTINALKLVSKRFEGEVMVALSLFSSLNIASFENICRFLRGINPNFLIKVLCPFQNKYEFQKCIKRGRYEFEEIALRYFHIDQTLRFSKRIKSKRSLLREEGSDRINLIKIREWEWTRR